MEKKQTIILAQALISCLMAFLMTGIFTFVEFGLTQEWAAVWLRNYIVAWPVAFVLSLVVSHQCIKLAIRLTA